MSLAGFISDKAATVKELKASFNDEPAVFMTAGEPFCEESNKEASKDNKKGRVLVVPPREHLRPSRSEETRP